MSTDTAPPTPDPADDPLPENALHRRPRYMLTQLLAEVPPEGLPRIEGWEEMRPVGREII